MVINLLSAILIVTGLVFFLGAATGLVRFPDFYTRMHAAGKGDTLSSLLVILGFALYQLDAGDWDRSHWLVALKLLAICGFIMITSPTSTHALMNAGYEDGCVPQIGPGGNALADDGMAPGGYDDGDGAVDDSPSTDQDSAS
jgi:multicomponent Na+:H+ antiporter subunit G